MARRFHRITLAEFADLLERFPFTRTVNAVHMHHTWRPNHAQFRGHDSIVSMWRHHTGANGWSDIAQHLTIDPQGFIWTGRSWNLPPASASGHNGSSRFGPFMFEMVGDFDVGRDRFEGAQRETALAVVALVQRHFGLEPGSLAFHRSMSQKSCPGSGIDYEEVLAAVRELHVGGPATRSAAAARDLPFGADALAINDVLRELAAAPAQGSDPADAEPAEEGEVEVIRVVRPGADAGRDAQGGGLSPEQLAALRPHVVNLRQGEFSGDGVFTTTPEDVEAIFTEDLEREAAAAEARGEPLRIVLYAHGGLTSESDGLRLAADHVRFWVANGIYPLYFIWETGLFETIGQLLERTRVRSRAGARDIWDRTTDPIVAEGVRALHVPTVWGGMKRSAERASAPDGGARFAAERLAEFCRKHEGKVELHAVGHSAGAVFHSHFLPAAIEAGVPGFRTVHFLAPALRVDSFRARLAPHLGKGVEHLTLYTMRKDLERADHCRRIYRKSLLYLIYEVLEPQRRTPILGLEENLRADPEVRRLFGLGGAPSTVAEVVWSTSPSETGRGASRSTTHGGFDHDGPTFESMARRILDRKDADPLKAVFPRRKGRAASGDWPEAVDWPEALDLAPPPAPAVQVPAAYGSEPPADPGRGAGRRRALCVGIDEYRSAPLSGCVADARLWARTLRRVGFDEPRVLLNGEATRAAILDGLKELVTASRPGDVVVFQYAGHGTQLPDLDGDEAGGDTPDRDEALCSFDMDDGAFVIDDDIGEVLSLTPEGVNVTFFIDCCHSGTISRLGVGGAPSSHAGDARPRFLPATQAMKAAHQRFRQARGLSRAGGGTQRMPEVLFSACLSSEVAWESGGQGEFTVRATQVLGSGVEGLTNEGFHRRVEQAFGAGPRQHPQLDCDPALRGLGLLQPVAAGAGAPAKIHLPGGVVRPSMADVLRMVADQLA